MKRVILFITLLSATLAQAVSVQTQSASIDANSHVIISATDLPGNERDWVAIFPDEAANTFANIVVYRFTHGIHAGDIDMGLIPPGRYEARSFNAGSWQSTSRYHFAVVGNARVTHVTTTKDTFATNESVHATFDNMPGDNHDWLAIFPVGATSTFANIVAYHYTNAATQGDIDFGRIPAGNYEVRGFYANSWRAVSTHTFSVEGADVSPTITTSKESYSSAENVTLSITNMPGDNQDWVAIFPVGVASTFANIVTYRYTNGLQQGDIQMGTLPAGHYEARSFYAHSWRVRASHPFTVTEDQNPTIVYEDFEAGNLDKWRIAHDTGNPDANMRYITPSFDGSQGCIRLQATARAEQNIYAMPMRSTTRTILEVDVGGFAGLRQPHYLLGVIVQTQLGRRIMIWDSFYNHQHQSAHINGEYLAYQSPIELVRGFGYAPVDQVETFRVDLNQYLRQLEPNNRITQVQTFIAGGGYLDNIRLTSQ